jgi:dihydrofolate reductase
MNKGNTRKLIVTAFITADGIVESPEKWSFSYWNDEIGKFKMDELFAADAHLLGRVTYEGFATAWPSQKGDAADRLNNLPKFVVSTTLGKAEWNNSTIIRDNVPEKVLALKQQPGRDILIHCCPTLANTLMRHNLIDEYRLLLFPIVLGNGKRLFKEGCKAPLRLIESKAFSKGVVLLRYYPDEAAAK